VPCAIVGVSPEDLSAVVRCFGEGANDALPLGLAKPALAVGRA
jgi:hypothetical protein